MIDQLGELAAVLLAASLASERLVVMVKTLAPSLLSLEEANAAESRKHSERRRRLIVMVASLIASTLTVGFLAEDVSGIKDYLLNLVVGHVTIAGQDWPVLVLGLLASGGSAFWAQVVGYASAAKDIRRVQRANLGAGGGGEVARDRTLPSSLKQAATRHLKNMHGDAFEFLADGAVQTTSAGVSVVHLQQVHEGIPIFDGALLVRFDRADQVIGARGTPTPVSPNSSTIPALPASRALEIAVPAVLQAIKDEGSTPPQVGTLAPRKVSAFAAPTRPTLLEQSPFESPIRAELAYWPGEESARLAWVLDFACPNDIGDFEVVVPADRPTNVSPVYVRRSQAHGTSGFVFEFNPDEKQLEEHDFPRPINHYPPFGGPQSAFGEWVHANDTEGNNVGSYRRNTNGGLSAAQTANDLEFKASSQDSEGQWVLNAFYLCNLMHDFFLLCGFDEAAGNFQDENFTGKGDDEDSLEIHVFDNELDGIASMRSRRDGRRPQMKLGKLGTKHSALDAEVVIHEFVHGVTNRIIGGSRNQDPLRGKEQSEAIGEGYSDFFALTIVNHYRREAGLAENFVYGKWLSSNTATGLRQHDYASSVGTYGDLGGPKHERAHDAGQVWCKALLEVRGVLVSALGAAPGEVLCWQMVMDSLKLVTPSFKGPTFLDGRDALLDAFDDLVVAGRLAGSPSTVRGEIVAAFGRLGMGPNAKSKKAGYDDVEAHIT